MVCLAQHPFALPLVKHLRKRPSVQRWVCIQTQSNQDVTFPWPPQWTCDPIRTNGTQYNFVGISRKEVLALFH